MKLFKASQIIFLAISLFFTSCIITDAIKGEGDIITREIILDEFTSVHLLGSFNIIVAQGENQKVVAVGHENIIERLKTEVHNDVWDVHLQQGSYRDYELTIYITIPNIEQVYVTGSGDITINDFEGQADLDLKISGSGKLTLNEMEGTQNLSVKISGSGEIIGHSELTDLQNLSITITGSGDFSGFPVQTDNCDIRITGSGDCDVHVNTELDVQISGSGDVNYKGYPNIIQNISGSGDLNNVN